MKEEKSMELLEYIKDGKCIKISNVSNWEHRKKEIISNFLLTTGKIPYDLTNNKVDYDIIDEVDLVHSIRREILYKIKSEDSIRAYLFIPQKATTCRVPTVLCLHQTNGILGCEEPAGIGGNESYYYGLELAKRGYITLMPDYPYMGKNNSDVYSFGYMSATMKGVRNHMAALDILESLSNADTTNGIGCIGHSLGGHNSVFLSLLDDRVSVCVSSSGVCAFEEYAKTNGNDIRGWASKKYMPLIYEKYDNDPKKMPWDFPQIIACLAPRGVFLNAPVYDTNMNHEGHLRIIRAVLPVYELYGALNNFTWCEPDAGHSFTNDVRKNAYRFLDDHLASLS